MVYKTKGVCAQGIEFEIDDNKKVHNIKFTGGCSGNTQGVAQLAEGMDADEVISRLEGIRCGFKPTSCPDQLAKAIRQALNEGGSHIILFCISDLSSPCEKFPQGDFRMI